MTKKHSLLALLLLVPAPSIGVLIGMRICPNDFGRAVFFIFKLWLLLLPLVWHVFVDKQKLSLSKPSNGGFVVAGLLGLAMSAVMITAYILLGKHLIDPQVLKDMMAGIELDDRRTYLLGAAYWILVNSVLEEYVWRWFVVKKCQSLMSTNAAIVVSAICFTIHHVVAMSMFFNWLVVSVASVGLFVAGAVWSWCYSRYQSVWPGYISHAIVDIAVFGVGYILIFG
ncbi:MAG: CPBP family intramembrane metalloprotease [Anaerohalosphaera sp.]|nr:CPBP family intramembrane metalloprotease [Anaerohalosphaera sp.]